MGGTSLEAEFRKYLIRKSMRFIDRRRSKKELDYIVYFGHVPFQLDVKEKRQPVDITVWPAVDFPEKDLFILDDLAARKILRQSPYSGMLVLDRPSKRLVFFDVVTLWSVPRVRVNRVLNPGKTLLKGKWLIDLRNGYDCANFADVLSIVESYIKEQQKIFEGWSPCFGDFHGEDISAGGRLRTKGYRYYDYWVTR